MSAVARAQSSRASGGLAGWGFLARKQPVPEPLEHKVRNENLVINGEPIVVVISGVVVVIVGFE